MFRNTIWLITGSIILLQLAACGLSSPKSYAVTESDAGRRVALRKGDFLRVTLVGNPSTGFMWEPQSINNSIIRQKGVWDFKADNTSPGFAGSPGKLTLRFEAVGSGQMNLKFIYHRPWETDVPPIQTFEITVVVK